MALTPRSKKILVALGYGAFFTVAFAYFAVQTFPFEDARSRVELELRRATGKDVEIGELRGWRGLGVELEEVTLTSADGSSLVLDALRARLAPLSLFTGKPKVDVELDAFGGTLDATIERGKEAIPVQATLRDVDVRAVLPLIASAAPKELRSTIDADVDVVVYPGDASKTEGTVHLKFAGAAWAGGAVQGLTIDAFSIGDLEGDINFADKKALFSGFGSKSPDLETTIEGQIDLAPKFDLSTARWNFKLKPAPKLLAEKPKLKTMIEIAAAGAKAPDGSISFTLAGPIKKLAVKKGS